MTPAPPPAAFAIPGDLATLTGGYIYERRLLEGLRAQGRDMTHLRLPAGFPDPAPDEMAEAVEAMAAVPASRPLIVDGLVFGAVETAGLARVQAAIVAMIHHPLALESGLGAARRAHLFATERDNLALARHVLVPSPHTARTLVERYGADPARITVAPPGIDRPTGPRHPTAPPLILSVGILHPRKGHDILLAALARITDLDWRAVIVGKVHDADHAAALERLRASLGLRDRVRLAGEIDTEALDALYRDAHVFALATRYEGYGIVLAEALAHGLPLVSCHTGAVPDTVPAGAGTLVPPEDPAAFAGALRRMLVDADHAAACAAAAAQAGARLPAWTDTAEIAGRVLDLVAAERPGGSVR